MIVLPPRLPAALAALTVIGSVSLAVPATAAGANPLGSEMFGISTGGSIQNEDTQTMERDLDEIARTGSRWIRIDINWAQIQAQGPTSYSWDAIDRVVRAATERGMKVLGIILYTPSWARPPGTGGSHPPDPERYAEFAGVAAEHYAAMGVHDYEVWNEPNIPRFWEPGPDPAAYTQLLRAAYPAIKTADPQATVLTGGTAPAFDSAAVSPVDFLQAIYANGGGDSFDAVSHHPYCWPALPGGQACTAWLQMHATDPSLRSVMAVNGDGEKKIWATEFGAPTGGPNGVSEDAQASMILRSYSLWRTYEWAGPLFTYQGRDHGSNPTDGENFFGLLRYDYSEKPAFAAYRAAVDGASDLGDATQATGETAVTVQVRGSSEKGTAMVRGRVSTTSEALGTAGTGGRVALGLQRKAHGRWRGTPRKRVTDLEAGGHFHLRLSTFRLRRRPPGTYRVHASFVGPASTSRTTDCSNSFKLRR